MRDSNQQVTGKWTKKEVKQKQQRRSNGATKLKAIISSKTTTTNTIATTDAADAALHTFRQPSKKPKRVTPN